MTYAQVLGGERSHASWSLLLEHGHRVANEYALANAMLVLAAGRAADLEARAVLQEAADRLMAYSEAHRSLQPPSHVGIIDLASYLRPICQAIARARLAERDVRLTLVEAPIELDAQRCLRVAAIVSELITNAIKHRDLAFASEIVVEMAVRDGKVFCGVRDNAACCTRATGRRGQGSRILEFLAEELGGTIEHRFRPTGGASILSFPQFASA